MLIAGGVSVNLKNENGSTALMLASARGHVDTVARLLEGGADPGLRNKVRKTAASLAIASGHREVAGLLESRRSWRSWVFGNK